MRDADHVAKAKKQILRVEVAICVQTRDLLDQNQTTLKSN